MYKTKLAPRLKWWQFLKRRKANKSITISLSNKPTSEGVIFKVIDPTTKTRRK